MKSMENFEEYVDEITQVDLLPIKSTVLKNQIREGIERTVKRIVDILGGLVGTIFLIPLTLCIYIMNFINGDRGPVFYVQERIGKDGQKFRMYKYRSMVIDAEEKLEKYLEENEEAKKEYKKYHKLSKDPRITKIGNFLRRTSIDEFPQFINVLKGDMSLVGPRPYLPRERGEMNGYFQYITEMRPGITGYWQVAGRNDVTFADRVRMDMAYYNYRSLKTDVKLMVKTALKVFKKEGAM